MADNIEIARFNFNVDDVVSSAAELKGSIDETKDAIKGLKESQAILKKYGKEGTIAFEDNNKALVENEANLKLLNSEYNKHIKVITENTKATADAANEEQLLTLVLSQEVSTIKEARDQNKLLNDLRNNTNVTTAEGQAKLKLLNDKLDSNNKLVKDNADAYLKQKINIGNYTQSIEKALGGVQIFGVSLSDLKSTLTQVTDVLALVKKDFLDTAKATTTTKTATEGLSGAQKMAFITTNTLVNGLKLLRLALISTGIGAIVVVLGSLITYLSTTQKGIDAVTSVTRPLTAVFQTLLGIVQKFGGDLFENPLKNLKKLGDFVKNQLTQYFTGLGKIVTGIFTFDSDKIKEGSDQLKKLSNDNAKALKGFAKGIGDQFSEAIKKGKELDRLQKELEQVRIANVTAVSALNEELKETNRLAEDQTKPIAEREAAAARSIQVAKEINVLKQKELDLEIAILENKQSRNDTSNAEKLELAELLAKRNEFNAQQLEIETTQQNKLNGIRKQAQTEAAANAKKAQDEAIARQRTLLAIYQETDSHRSKTLTEQLEQFENVAKKETEILDQELKNKSITREEYNLAILQLDNELKARQAEIAIETAAEELRIYREGIDAKLEANQFLSDEIANQRKEDNANFLRETLEFERLKLEQGLINQTEFDTAIREAKEETRLANEAIDIERENVAREEAKALRAIAFEEELELLNQQRSTRFELEQAQANEQRQLELDALNESRDKGLISEELFKAKQAQIDGKYKKLELQREETLAQQKISAITGTIGAVASVIDQNSTAGKALGLAQAMINTYQGISAGVKLGYPAAIPAVAAAAATGFKAVKQIASQKLPSITGQGEAGGGGSRTAGLGADLSSITGQNVNLNSIAASGNSAVQSQIENQANINGLADNVAQAVEQGAQKGTSKGTEQGMTNLSDNKDIMQKSKF